MSPTTTIAWRFTNISSRGRGTPPTVATAGSVRAYKQLSDSSNKDKGTSRTEPDDFSVMFDSHEDPTNDALDPEALMRTLYNLQDTDDEHDRDRDARTLNTLTIHTAVEAVQLADYNNAPISALEDEHIINNDSEDESDNDDTTITETSEPVLSTVASESNTVTSATTISALHVFTVDTSSSGSLSGIQALPMLGAFSQDTSVPLNETMHYSRGDVPLSELKLGLWCLQTGVSRSDFSALSEILRSSIDSDVVQALPITSDTIKKHVKEAIPLLEIRKMKVPLNSERLPIQAASSKDNDNDSASMDE